MMLRRVNFLVGAVLAVQAIVVTVLLVGVGPVLLPVTADFGGGIPIASVNLGAATVVLLAFAAFERLVRPSPIARFIEWSQISGVTIFLLAQLNGVTDIAALVSLYALTAGATLFLVLHEGRAPDEGRWTYSFGAAVAIVPWGVIAFYQVGAIVTDSDPGLVVRVLTVGLLLIASAYWYDMRLARVKERARIAEVAHLVFASATVAILAWTSLAITAG